MVIGRRPWTWSVVALGVLAGAVGSPGQAQQPPTFELPEVVVPGKRPQDAATTPASVTVITRADLDRLSVRTLADALRLVPELVVRRQGGLGSLAVPSLRGSTPAQVLVLLDGVPLNNVALGQADLSTVSTDGIERIEVLRGPFAAVYGSGALGGVINIITTRTQRGQLLASWGSLDSRALHVQAGAGDASGGWQMSLSVDSTQGHRPNSDFTGTTVLTNVTVTPALRIGVHHFNTSLGSPGITAFPSSTDRQSEQRTLVHMGWGRDDKIGLTGRLYYLTDQLTFTSPFGSSPYASTVTGGELQHVWVLDSGKVVTAGIELQRQTLNASVFGGPIVRENLIGAGYIQYDAALSSQWLASLGIRLDTHSIYGTTLNPRAGVVYALDEGVRVRAAVGRTFRGPTFLELYYPGCSNPNLRPEYAWAGEVGVERISPDGMRLAATVFGSEAQDRIVGGCNPRNVGSVAIRGITGEVRLPMGMGWIVSADVTVQRAIDQTTGSAILRVPDIMAHMTVSYPLTPTSSVTLIGEYVGVRPDIDFSVFPSPVVQMPPFVELQFRYKVTTHSGWTITAGINNLLDQSYEAVKGYPMPGRTLFVTATQRF